MLEKIKETAEFLKAQVAEMPKIAIILGSGLGNLVDHMTDKKVIPYKNIPNFPVSTVAGHSGNFVFGKLGDKSVIAMQGRFHYYEGYDMKTVTFPVRVFKALGVETLFVSNAAGGMTAAQAWEQFTAPVTDVSQLSANGIAVANSLARGYTTGTQQRDAIISAYQNGRITRGEAEFLARAVGVSL